MFLCSRGLLAPVKRSLRFRHPTFQTTRYLSFNRRTVTSPFGIKLLKGSQRFLVIVGAVYGAAITGIGGLYLYTTWRLEQVQPIPSDWTFIQKLYGLAGANHSENGRHKVVVEYYEKLVNQLVVDKDGEVIELDSKTAAWMSGYADIVIRLGLAKVAIGQENEGIQALESGLSIPFGQKTLKSQAATELSQLRASQGDTIEAEKLGEEALGYILPEQALVRSASDGIILAPEFDLEDLDMPSSSFFSSGLGTKLLMRAQVDALTQLSKVYVRQRRPVDALNLFLGVLSIIRKHENILEEGWCYESATMSFISEVLWSLSQKREAVIWAEGSYYKSIAQHGQTEECNGCSEVSSDNLAKMYKSMGMLPQSEKFRNINSSLQPTSSNRIPTHLNAHSSSSSSSSSTDA